MIPAAHQSPQPTASRTIGAGIASRWRSRPARRPHPVTQTAGSLSLDQEQRFVRQHGVSQGGQTLLRILDDVSGGQGGGEQVGGEAMVRLEDDQNAAFRPGPGQQQ